MPSRRRSLFRASPSCRPTGSLAHGTFKLRAAAIFAAVFAFDKSSFVFGETAVLGMDCEPRSSARMAFSPATVNFNEYAWPVSSSRRQISIPDFALISLTRPAFRSLAATFCVAAAFRVFGAMRQLILAFRRLEQNRTLCVSKFGRRTHRDHPLGFGGAVAVTTASPEWATSRAGPRIADHFIGGSLLQAPERP